MADVFLSYARPSAATASRVAKALGEAGYSVWFDSDLPAHRTYSDVIASELEGAKAVVVLWSADAVESQWVRSEANRARELGKLVQARLDEARLPMPFDQIQCADLSGWRRARSHPGWKNVTGSIGALVGRDQTRSHSPPTHRRSFGRREVVAGGAAAALAAGGGGWWFLRGRSRGPKLSPEDTALMEQSKAAIWQNTPDGQNQAIGMTRQVVADYPDYASGWGRLSMAYAIAGHWRGQQEAKLLHERGQMAAGRSLSLDPEDRFGLIGSAISRPYLGNWRNVEQTLRRATALWPKDGEVNFMLAVVLGIVGRAREALDHVLKTAWSNPAPGAFVLHAQMLWSGGRNEELDALLDEATKLYPTHFGVWFTRFYTLMMGGRPDAALAFAANTSSRPLGIDPVEVEMVVRVAKAVQSPSAKEIDAIASVWMERARHGAGYAENAAQFMATLGRPDEAFAALRAYYFGEGFDPGEVRFGGSTGSFTASNDRQTAFLFNPALAPIRADARFAKLMNDLHFADYWRASGVKPDYLA